MKRLCCKDYCPLWDSVDKDCEVYGEKHPRLRECPIYRSRHKEELEKLKHTEGFGFEVGKTTIRKNRTVEKKILPEFFADVVNGNKTFEIRKDEDNIQAGDKLLLREWNVSSYTGKEISCDVSYVLRNARQFGLMDGFCVIGIKVREKNF